LKMFNTRCNVEDVHRVIAHGVREETAGGGLDFVIGGVSACAGARRKRQLL